MKMLVLDKSAVQAAPRGFLASLRMRFTFVLTDTLLHEIATARLDERDALSDSERDALDRRITANYDKTIEEAGNSWIDNVTALSYEVVRGYSAKHAPRWNLKITPSAQILSAEQKQLCFDYEARLGALMSVVHAPQDQEDFDRVRSYGEEELFRWIRQSYSSQEVRRRLAQETRRSFAENAKKRGLEVSRRFRPRPGWFAFGVTSVGRAFLSWKFSKKGDQAADPRKPANPFFDTIYIAYISIANGMLSCDKDLLKLSWACWPEKEKNLYEFDMQSHEIRVFEPRWSS